MSKGRDMTQAMRACRTNHDYPELGVRGPGRVCRLCLPTAAARHVRTALCQLAHSAPARPMTGLPRQPRRPRPECTCTLHSWRVCYKDKIGVAGTTVRAILTQLAFVDGCGCATSCSNMLAHMHGRCWCEAVQVCWSAVRAGGATCLSGCVLVTLRHDTGDLLLDMGGGIPYVGTAGSAPAYDGGA